MVYPPPQIGELNESSLHRALKEAYRRPGDRIEATVEGFTVDLLRDDLVIEIQTTSFRSMGRKLDRLLDQHKLLVVHPIAADTVLQRPDRPPRMSPKHLTPLNLFDELVSVPTLLDHPHLSIDVVSCKVAAYQDFDPSLKRGRGGHRTRDRRLVEVYEIVRFDRPSDLLDLLPDRLPDPFTTADLASAAGVPRRLAQRAVYVLSSIGLLSAEERRRDGVRYRTSDHT